MLEVESNTKFQLLSLFNIVGPFFGSNKELGGTSLSLFVLNVFFINFYFCFVLHMIFFCRIMKDARPHMWTHFIIENEMTTIVVLPLLEGFSSSIVVAPPLLQLPIVKLCHKKKKKG